MVLRTRTQVAEYLDHLMEEFTKGTELEKLKSKFVADSNRQNILCSYIDHSTIINVSILEINKLSSEERTKNYLREILIKKLKETVEFLEKGIKQINQV